MTRLLPLFAAALWWGSLSAIGYLAVPLLFASLPSPAIAGNVAARLFAGQTWVSVGCGVALLLVYRRKVALGQAGSAQIAIVFVLLGLLLALLLQYGVAPRILTRIDLRLWHSLGAGLYTLQWLCAAIVLWRLGRVKEALPHA